MRERNEHLLTRDEIDNMLKNSLMHPVGVIKALGTISRFAVDHGPIQDKAIQDIIKYNIDQKQGDLIAFSEKYGVEVRDAALRLGKLWAQNIVSSNPNLQFAIDEGLKLASNDVVSSVIEKVYPDYQTDITAAREFLISGVDTENALLNVVERLNAIEGRLDRAVTDIGSQISQNRDLSNLVALNNQDIVELKENFKSFGMSISEDALCELAPDIQVHMKQVAVSLRLHRENLEKEKTKENMIKQFDAAIECGNGLSLLGSHFKCEPLVRVGNTISNVSQGAKAVTNLLAGGLTTLAMSSNFITAGVAVVGVLNSLFGSDDTVSQFEWLKAEIVNEINELKQVMLEEFNGLKLYLSDIHKDTRHQFSVLKADIEDIRDNLQLMRHEQRKNTKKILNAVVYISSKNHFQILSEITKIQKMLNQCVQLKDAFSAVNQYQNRRFSEIVDRISQSGRVIEANRVYEKYNLIKRKLARSKKRLDSNKSYIKKSQYERALDNLLVKMNGFCVSSFLSGVEGDEGTSTFSLLHYQGDANADIKLANLPEFDCYNDHHLDQSESVQYVKSTSNEYFIRHAVLGDGNCGYTAFGIDRIDAFGLLTQNLNDIRDILQPAIREVFQIQAGDFVNYVLHNHHEYNAEQLVQAYHNYINNNDFSGLQVMSNDLNILSAYLEYDVRDRRVQQGWSHPSILQALASTQDIHLVMWRRDAEIVPHRVGDEDYHNHNPTGNQRVDLLFVNGVHFERLEKVDNPAEKAGSDSIAIKQQPKVNIEKPKVDNDMVESEADQALQVSQGINQLYMPDLLKMPLNGLCEYLNKNIDTINLEALPNFAWFYKFAVLYIDLVEHYRLEKRNLFEVERGQIMDRLADFEQVLNVGLAFERVTDSILNNSEAIQQFFFDDGKIDALNNRLTVLLKSKVNGEKGEIIQRAGANIDQACGLVDQISQIELDKPDYDSFKKHQFTVSARLSIPDVRYRFHMYGVMEQGENLYHTIFRAKTWDLSFDTNSLNDVGAIKDSLEREVREIDMVFKYHNISHKFLTKIYHGSALQWNEKTLMTDHDPLNARWTAYEYNKNVFASAIGQNLNIEASKQSARSAFSNTIDQLSERDSAIVTKFINAQKQWLESHRELVEKNVGSIDISSSDSYQQLLENIQVAPLIPVITSEKVNDNLILVIPTKDDVSFFESLFKLNSEQKQALKHWVFAEMLSLGEIRCSYLVDIQEGLLTISAKFVHANTKNTDSLLSVSYPFVCAPGHDIQRALMAFWTGGSLASLDSAENQSTDETVYDQCYEFERVSVQELYKKAEYTWMDNELISISPDDDHGSCKPDFSCKLTCKSSFPQFVDIEYRGILQETTDKNTLQIAKKSMSFVNGLPQRRYAKVSEMFGEFASHIAANTDVELCDALNSLDEKYRILQYILLLTNSVNAETQMLCTDSKVNLSTNSLITLSNDVLCLLNKQGFVSWVNKLNALVNHKEANPIAMDTKMVDIAACLDTSKNLLKQVLDNMFLSESPSLHVGFKLSLQMLQARIQVIEGELKHLEDYSINCAKGEDQIIGRGSAAIVSKREYGNGEVVAVKEFFGIDANQRRDFFNEVNIMMLLNHPNIVNLIRIDESHLAYEMEYVERGSLYSILHESEACNLSIDQRMSIMLDCYKGLSYLHEQRVIHRDIKSLNVLIGADYIAKLCDMSIAKISNATQTNMTSRGTTDAHLGTARWQAQELLSGNARKHKFSSDIQSMGFMSNEVLTGVLPFADAMTTAQIVGKAMKKVKPSFPGAMRANMRAFCLLADWAMDDDPSLRPTARELVAGMQAIMNPEHDDAQAFVVINQMKGARRQYVNQRRGSMANILRALSNREEDVANQPEDRVESEEQRIVNEIEEITRRIANVMLDVSLEPADKMAELAPDFERQRLLEEQLDIARGSATLNNPGESDRSSSVARIGSFVKHEGRSPGKPKHLVVRLSQDLAECDEVEAEAEDSVNYGP